MRQVNLESLPKNPAFSHAVVVETPARTIEVGGQNGVADDGTLVGDTIADQTRQAFDNLATVLAAEGARLADTLTTMIPMPMVRRVMRPREHDRGATS